MMIVLGCIITFTSLIVFDLLPIQYQPNIVNALMFCSFLLSMLTIFYINEPNMRNDEYKKYMVVYSIIYTCYMAVRQNKINKLLYAGYIYFTDLTLEEAEEEVHNLN